MIGFVPAESQLGDLVCRFKKDIFDPQIVPIVRKCRSGKKTIIGTATYYTDSITPCPVFYRGEEQDKSGFLDDEEQVDEDVTLSLHGYECLSDIFFHLATETLQILSHTTSNVPAYARSNSPACDMDVDLR